MHLILLSAFNQAQVLFLLKSRRAAGGQSGSTEPTWNFTTNSTTHDGALTWTSQGVYTAGPVWGQNYGSQTQDGAVTWTNVGSAKYSTWSTSVTWYLPSSGFAPPSSSQPYGGAEVIGNSDVQAVIQSGLSGGSVPSWGTIGSNTVDNDAIWYTIAAATSNSLAWTAGYSYAYSYKARENNDYYSPVSVGGGGNLPPGVANALSAPTGSESGGISTASPAFNIVGSNAGAVNTVSGIGSTDPQVDTVVIWRSPDSAAGSSNMLELTEIPNPPPVNGQAQPWTFKDYLPDNPTSVYPGLDVLSPAPIGDVNNPPPTNYIPMVYNFQRIWGSSGQLVQWSGGPDTLVGNPNECYNPDDDFPYLANVLRLIKNSQGIVVFTTDSTEFLGGGPQTSSFYTVTLAPGIGLGNFNGADIYAGEIFFVSADSQFKSINPSLQLSNLGFPIGDQIADLDSSKVYVAVNQVGVDNAIYIADGSTGWWRCNPHQVPQNEPIWSPFASITNGCKMVQSVEISPGQKRLLVGGTGCNQQILERNLNTFSDNGVAYSECYFVMGSITLCHPGQVAILRAIEIDGNMTPTVGVLIDEIAGSFTTLSQHVYDPPSLVWHDTFSDFIFPHSVVFCPKARFSESLPTSSNTSGHAFGLNIWRRDIYNDDYWPTHGGIVMPYGDIFSFTKNQAQQTAQEPDDNYGMGPGWAPINSAPIDPNKPAATRTPASVDPYGSGPLPPNFGYQPALVRSGYGGTAAPIDLMPIQGAGVTQANAKSITTAAITVKPIASQAASAQSTATQANSTAQAASTTATTAQTSANAAASYRPTTNPLSATMRDPAQRLRSQILR